MKKMKKNYKTRLLVTLLIMVLMLFGCGNTQVESTPTPVPEEKENEVVEETTVEEPEVVEDVQEETTEGEEQQETPATPMVDWETFAAQADNDEICIVVTNEDIGYQDIIKVPDGEENTFYESKEGDKFAVPIRDNIYWIDIVTIKDLEVVSDERIYFKEESNQSLQFIEVSFPKGNNYNLSIKIEESQEPMQFLIMNE